MDLIYAKVLKNVQNVEARSISGLVKLYAKDLST